MTRITSARLVGLAVTALLLAMIGLQSQPESRALATGNAIQLENSLPGDPTWNDFQSVLQDGAISGYGSQISINRGGAIDFYVTTTAANVTIDIFRTGWYGGTGARKLTSLGTFPGVQQAIPPPDPVTGIIVCNWTKTATLNVPSTWTSGVYLAKLTASSGNKSFIFFVVRNDGGQEDLVVQTSVTTYQAYNNWGGTGLYNNFTNQSIYRYGASTKVSFDRPFSPGSSNGAGQYLSFEYPFVRWAESQGMDLTYTTNIDTHTNINPLSHHKAFLSVGHDEYWTKEMRNNVQAAINGGVNVAFFSANSSYWQIRLAPSAAGVPNRIVVGYKGSATDPTAPGPDPMLGVNNSVVTTNWREDPVNLPENGLIGVMYEDIISHDAAYVVQNASHWVYAGTGFANGSSVPGIVGYEYDKVFSNGATPAGLTILSQSPVVGQTAGSSHANSSIYTAPSGARVFAAGTIEWSWGLDNYPNRSLAHPGIQRTTANILYNFSGGTPPPTPTPLPTGVRLADGFESGNTTLWTGPQGTGQAAAESTTANSGTYGVGLTTTSGQYVGLYADLQGASQPQSFTRFCFRLGSGLSGSALLAQGLDSSGNPLWRIDYDDPRKSLDVYFWNGARARQDVYGTPNVLSLNIWYCAEVNVNAATSGHGEIWLNGTSIGSVNADLSVTQPYSRLTLWNNGAVGTLYIDDVKVAGSLNGPVGAGTSPLPIPTSTPTLAPTSTPTPPGTPLPAGQYVLTDFEVGFGLLVKQGPGSAVIQSTTVNQGTNAVALTNASGEYVGLAADLQGGPQAQTFTRFCFRLASGISGSSVLAQGRDPSGNPMWEVDYDAPRASLDIYFWNGARTRQDVYPAAHLLTPDTWYCAEVQVNASSSGHGEVWLNGTSIGSVNADLSVAQPYSRLALWNNGATGTVFMDDIRVANTYSGPTGVGATPLPIPTNTPTNTPTPTPLPPTATATPLPTGQYVLDNFDNGPGIWVMQGPGSATLQSTTVNSGTGAVALTNAANQYVGIFADLQGGSQPVTFTRFCFRLGTGVGTVVLAQGRAPNGDLMWEVDYDAPRNSLDVYFWNGNRARQDVYPLANIVVLNTWYCAEVQVTAATQASGGHGEVWLNGTSVGSVNADLSTAQGAAYSRLMLWNNAAVGTVYMDDVKVANTYNGPTGAGAP